jgi:hypothetical protein
MPEDWSDNCSPEKFIKSLVYEPEFDRAAK